MGMDIFKWFRRPVTARRNYEAARPSRIAGGFPAIGGTRSANEEIRWDLRGLIAHSRKQAQNNDYLKAYLGLVARNVVGPSGIRLQNQARNENGTPDTVANDLVEDAWARWGRKGSASLDGIMSWRQIEELTAQTVARDGTMLLRKYVGREFGPFLFRVQPLEVDFLDTEMNLDLPSGGYVRMGVECDADNRRVAYHLFTRHPGDYLPGRARERLRVPADQMLCIFRPERPGQMLGVPWAYTALRRLNMLRGYEEAAIAAARAGASKMGFLEKSAGADDLTPEILDKQESTEAGHLITEMEPGMIETLPVGYTYKEHNPSYPSGEMQPFMQTVLQGAAAGLGVSYVTLANDLRGANFSSLRAGKGEERDEWRTLQNWLIDELHQPVFEAFLPLALLAGQAGSLPATKIAKFMKPRWRARGWAYVSPGEEANANQREMAALIRSPQGIVGERGDDLEDVFADIAAAKLLAESYGLVFDPRPPGHEQGSAPAAATDPAET